MIYTLFIAAPIPRLKRRVSLIRSSPRTKGLTFAMLFRTPDMVSIGRMLLEKRSIMLATLTPARIVVSSELKMVPIKIPINTNNVQINNRRTGKIKNDDQIDVLKKIEDINRKITSWIAMIIRAVNAVAIINVPSIVGVILFLKNDDDLFSTMTRTEPRRIPVIIITNKRIVGKT